MPINVFGNSSCSHDNGKKILNSIFGQRINLRTNYIVSKIQEDINMKNQVKMKNSPTPIYSN